MSNESFWTSEGDYLWCVLFFSVIIIFINDFSLHYILLPAAFGMFNDAHHDDLTSIR